MFRLVNQNFTWAGVNFYVYGGKNLGRERKMLLTKG